MLLTLYIIRINAHNVKCFIKKKRIKHLKFHIVRYRM
nr:MAG TPA: hypothetical protein [Caudoviricetes sp.]